MGAGTVAYRDPRRSAATAEPFQGGTKAPPPTHNTHTHTLAHLKASTETVLVEPKPKVGATEPEPVLTLQLGELNLSPRAIGRVLRSVFGG